MPLVALTDNDERIVSLDLCDNDRSMDFRCPYCDSDLSLVISKNKITHFRHHDKSQCIFSGETKLHLECKEFLYNHYVSTGKYDVELESRQFITNGRPKRIGDVVLIPKKGTKSNPVVIEVQNSNIELEEVKNRFSDWNGGGFDMLWVLTQHTPYKKLPKWAYVLWVLCGGQSNVYSRTYRRIVIQSDFQSDPVISNDDYWESDPTILCDNLHINGFLTNMEIVKKPSHLGISQLKRV